MTASRLQQALAAHKSGRLDQAAQLYRDVLRGNPNDVEALTMLGDVCLQTGQWQNGERHLAEALRIDPDSIAARYLHGRTMQKLARPAEAVADFNTVLRHDRTRLDALVNRGVAFLALQRPADALRDFEAASRLEPDRFEVLVNRGSALSELGRYEEALECYDRALASNPVSFEAWNYRGTALAKMFRYEEALASYESALKLRPQDIGALSNCGNVLTALSRFQEALNCYDAVLAREPHHENALFCRIYPLNQLGRQKDAVSASETFARVYPDRPFARDGKLRAKTTMCEWHGLDDLISHIARDVRSGKPAIEPHSFLMVSNSSADNLTCARSWVEHKKLSAVLDRPAGRVGGGKIKLAYLSADFRDHATAHLMAGVFEQHDKGRFETYAISFGMDLRDDMRARLERAFDRFIDVRNKSDRQVAGMLAGMNVDIAVDLKGYTNEARPGIFTLRPAPVQINYLGFPGTLAMPAIDYIIADSVLIPEGDEAFFSEAVVRLPHSYQPADSARPISKTELTRAGAGLPERGFVFCSFNHQQKILPAMFDVWMRVLTAVPGSVLWLWCDNSTAMKNLKSEAERRQVAGDRLVFAPRMNQREHLARQSLGDLFLDTLPCCAHTTASDALWAGLPVLTCKGDTFAGRVAASVLRAAGVPELVTSSLDDYEALAVGLAQNPANLAAIKTKLAGNRGTAPLFDTRGFTRTLESAYLEMRRRHQRGEKPAGFSVEDAA